jgi:hypothetical protein
MSRGLGRIEFAMIHAIKNRGKPSSYADIVGALLQAIDREPRDQLNACRERSLRRALHNLVDKGVLIAMPGDRRGIRYSLHPADLTAEWASDYRAALNGNFEIAKAVAMAELMRVKPDQKIPPSADVMALAACVLRAAYEHLVLEKGQRS